MNLLTLIPFIVNRYTFYMIPMDLEMAFCGFHYRRTWRNIICFCFCFLLKTGGIFCTIVTKEKLLNEKWYDPTTSY